MNFDDLLILIRFLPELKENDEYRETEYYKANIKHKTVLVMFVGMGLKSIVPVIQDEVGRHFKELLGRYEKEISLPVKDLNISEKELEYSEKKKREKFSSLVKETRLMIAGVLEFLDFSNSEEVVSILDDFFKNVDKSALEELVSCRIQFHERLNDTEKILELSKPLFLSLRNKELLDLVTRFHEHIKVDQREIARSIVDNLGNDHFKKVLDVFFRSKMSDFGKFIYLDRNRRSQSKELNEYFFTLVKEFEVGIDQGLIQSVCFTIKNVNEQLSFLQRILRMFPEEEFMKTILKGFIVENFGEVELETSCKILREFGIGTEEILLRQLIVQGRKFSQGIEELKKDVNIKFEGHGKSIASLENRMKRVEKLLENQHREITENRRRIINLTPSGENTIPPIPIIRDTEFEIVDRRKKNTKKESPMMKKKKKIIFPNIMKTNHTNHQKRKKESERRNEKEYIDDEKILDSGSSEEEDEGEMAKNLLEKKFKEEEDDEDEDEDDILVGDNQQEQQDDELDMLLMRGSDDSKKINEGDEKKKKNTSKKNVKDEEEEGEYEEYEFSNDRFQHQRIFVGRVMSNIKKNDLMAYFRKFGKIESVELKNGNEYNSAWVEFSSPEDCYSALQNTYPEIPVSEENGKSYLVYLDVCNEGENRVSPPPEMKKLSMQNRLAEVGVSHIRTTRIRIHPLHTKVANRHVKELFEDCGVITNIRIVEKREDEDFGYCFVEFETKEAVIRACQRKHGAELKGLYLQVQPVLLEVKIKNEVLLKNLPTCIQTEEISKFFEDHLRENKKNHEEEKKVLNVEKAKLDMRDMSVNTVVAFRYLRHAYKAIELDRNLFVGNLSKMCIYPIIESGHIPNRNKCAVKGVESNNYEEVNMYSVFRSCGPIVEISRERPNHRQRQRGRGRGRGRNNNNNATETIVVEYLSAVDAKKCVKKFNLKFVWRHRLKVWTMDEEERDADTVLFVEGFAGGGNRNNNVSLNDIGRYFESFGRVKDVEYNNNRNQNFAKVEFETEGGARKCLEENEYSLKGRRLEVKRSKDRQAGLVLEGLVRTVVVGYFRRMPTKEQLEEFFSDCGQIERTNIDKSGYFAHIKFRTLRGAWDAVSRKNQKMFHGTRIVVDVSNNQNDEIGIGKDIQVYGIPSSTKNNEIKEFFELNLGKAKVIRVRQRKEKNEPTFTITLSSFEVVLKSMVLDGSLMKEGVLIEVYPTSFKPTNTQPFQVLVKAEKGSNKYMGRSETRKFFRSLFWEECGEILKISSNQVQTVTYINFQSRVACERCLLRDGEIVEGGVELKIFKQKTE